MENYKHSELTSQIIRAFYNVYNALGYGFLEKVYENAMMIELKIMGVNVVNQSPISVFYKVENVGSYFADLLVDDKVIVELKATADISDEHEAQLLNYLRATEIEVGLLLNFGKEATFKKKVFSNQFKKGIKKV